MATTSGRASHTGRTDKRGSEKYPEILSRSTAYLTAYLSEVTKYIASLLQVKPGAEWPKVSEFKHRSSSIDAGSCLLNTVIPEFVSCERASSRYRYSANAGCLVVESLPLTSSLSSPSNTKSLSSLLSAMRTVWSVSSVTEKQIMSRSNAWRFEDVNMVVHLTYRNNIRATSLAPRP